MQRVTTVRSPAIVLREPNIDTDRIIPARFLTTIEREGLGRHAFADWRRGTGGGPRDDCALNDPRARGASIIVAGRNFGCGSSREHAVWALADLGIRAVISCQIADIFASNAAKNGIIPALVDEQTLTELMASPWATIDVDVAERVIRDGTGASHPFTLDAFARYCLQRGIDHLAYLLSHVEAIDAFEQQGAAT